MCHSPVRCEPPRARTHSSTRRTSRERNMLVPLIRDPHGGTSMQELLVDFITSLDGYGAAEGWPGWWGLEGPQYLAWLGQQPERDYTILMGANTYRLMSGFAAKVETLEADEAAAVDELAGTPKVVFSS